MTAAYVRQKRELKAAGIEQAIVEAGRHEEYLASDCADPGIRAEALAKVGGSASRETWDVVAVFLRDRFVR